MGEELSLIWAVPFTCMLLSIALCPLLMPHFWHHHFSKVAMGWSAIFAIPFLMTYKAAAWHEIVHIMVLDYVPFLILLWALFTISGGILVKGSLAGTPFVNAILMLIGTVLASFVGTTGASMLLIRPILRANEKRLYKSHTVVFFIFLVSNIGGCLTPLGDPPLFLGFLHTVPFFWTVTALWKHFAVVLAIVIGIYLILDTIFYSREPAEAKIPAAPEPMGIEGSFNFLLLAGVIAGVLISGSWKPTHINHGNWVKNGGVVLIPDGGHDHHHDHDHDKKDAKDAHADHHDHDHASHGEEHHGVSIPVENIARDAILIAMGIISLVLTSKRIRTANGFSWFPIIEVAWLFAGIFITIIPALAILKSGDKGALAFLVKSVQTPGHYFWATGILSSFLDNAPTYLTFFNTALGRFCPGMEEGEAVKVLISQHPNYLVAISIGAVFMGANTYIGNAPNFMVRSIAEESGVRMPDFFSYIFFYSLPILIPTFAVVTWLFFGG